MDNRKLSTGDFVSMGYLSKPVPESDIPTDRAVADFDDAPLTVENVVQALEAGQLVKSSNYYGIPAVWRKAEGIYRGLLFQYRAVTEDETFATAGAAAEWFIDMARSTDG